MGLLSILPLCGVKSDLVFSGLLAPVDRCGFRQGVEKLRILKSKEGEVPGLILRAIHPERVQMIHSGKTGEWIHVYPLGGTLASL